MYEDSASKNYFIKQEYISRYLPNSKHNPNKTAYPPDIRSIAFSIAKGYQCQNIIYIHKPEAKIDIETLQNSIVVCTNLIEYLNNPCYLLANINSIMKYATACLLVTPERDLTRGPFDKGSPADLVRAREWNLDEFKQFLLHFNLNVEHLGLTRSDLRDEHKKIFLQLSANISKLKQ